MRTQLRPNEQKLLETRTHWMTVTKPFLLLLLAAALFILCQFFIHIQGDLGGIVRWASALFLAGAALYFLYREIYRRRDIWVVTNLRIIDEKGIFTLFSKESPLEKINNLSYRQSLLGRMLNYGQVEIQTAAEDGATIYRMVTGPRLLKDTVAQCREKFDRVANSRKNT
ncbi:MAG TPA: PH domain-containing protein [Acidobacteriota bacterium]